MPCTRAWGDRMNAESANRRSAEVTPVLSAAELAQRSELRSQQLRTAYWHKKLGLKIGGPEYRRIKGEQAFANRIRALVRRSLSAKGVRKDSLTEEVLGCSIAEFAAHIERQFLPGMTWENRHLWQIDHIVPMAAASSRSEVLALNHFTNLRPLWAADNLAKSDKRLFLL